MVKRKNSAPTKLTIKPQESIETEPDPPKKSKSDYMPHIHKFNSQHENYFLSNFIIGKTNNVIPENWTRSKVSFKDENLTLLIDGDAYVIIHISDLDYLEPIKGISLAL